MTRFDPALLSTPLLALALLAPAAAQEGAPAAATQDAVARTADNPLDALERLVGGQWNPDGMSMLNEYVRYRWGAGRRSVSVTSWRIGEDGIDPPGSVGLLYWDPEREEIVGTVVLLEGSVKEIRADLGPDQWDFHYDYYSGGGKNKMLESYDWADPDTCTMTMFIESSEWMKVDYSRQPEGSSALPVMPTDEGEPAKLGVLEPLMGMWDVANETPDGGTTATRTVCYWGLDRSVALFRTLGTVDGEEVPMADGLFYWSPATSSVRFLGVHMDGAVFRGSVAAAKGGMEIEMLRATGPDTAPERYLEQVAFPAEGADGAIKTKFWRLDGEERTLVQNATYERIPLGDGR